MARAKKAPGCFDRHGRGWRWRVCVGGRRHRFTIVAPDREAAERWARKKYDELDTQRLRRSDGLAVGVRMSELLTHFETNALPLLAPGAAAAYKDSLKPIRTYFVEQLGDPQLERVRPAHIADFLDWRRTHRLDGKAPLHGRTVAKDRAVLHRLFDVAEEREWRDGNPVAKVDAPDADDRQAVILTPAQYDALLDACRDPHVRLYVLLCGETGMRCESEVLWLRWEDVDLKEGFITVVSGRQGHRTKSGKSRSVPITPRLREALQAHLAEHRFAEYHGERPGHLFHHTADRRHYRAGARVHSFRRAVLTAAARAKLPVDWTMHDLRHRRVTSWLAEGHSPVLVKEALGHSDLRTTMGYAHLVKEHLRSLVAPPEAGHKLDTAAAQ